MFTLIYYYVSSNFKKTFVFTWKISCTHVGSGELWVVPFSPATFDLTLLVVVFCCLSAKKYENGRK